MITLLFFTKNHEALILYEEKEEEISTGKEENRSQNEMQS
jgi:hypothetical protein